MQKAYSYSKRCCRNDNKSYISPALIPSGLAIARIVFKDGLTLPVSSLEMVAIPTPDAPASSSCVISRLSRSAFKPSISDKTMISE